MHARTTELLAHLDRHHAAMRLAVDGVPRANRDRPPAIDRWSVANVVEHLARVETRVFSGLSVRVAEACARGLELATDTPVTPSTDDGRYLNRNRRLVATESARPTAGFDAETAWAQLEAARANTVRLVRETDGLELTPVVLPHPLFGPLNFYQWIIFLGGHEARHALQVQEVGRMLAEGQ